MSRRIRDGGRTSFRESKLWKFIQPDIGAWCLLAGEVILGGIALYVGLSQPHYINSKTPAKIEAPRDPYSVPVAYDSSRR